jgi:hypothetical protein
MKKFIQKIWDGIKNAYAQLVYGTKRYVPIAINIVESVKSVMDTPVDDIILEIIKKSIPGSADDVLIDKIKSVVEKYIPMVLLQLQIVDSIANITDKNEQLKAILERIKLSSNETQNIVWHGLGALILEKLSDGKISWSDSVVIAEYYFKNIHKKSNL